ncbi:MAG: indolepyruvate ferredoxin oxidoreductase family protein [Betaproteobacteria bacterium]|nr:MAG: indolepyruvate ferredoxin oxidoreductase family protein [Betaproteobacteria bacterium]
MSQAPLPTTSLPAAIARAIEEVKLDDRWTLKSGRTYMNGSHALLRLMMLQRQKDELAGLNTGGFLSGYRGSPLGAIDQNAWKSKKHLAASHITFQPGVNEELAATAVWGTQQLNLYPQAKYDGVFAMWYGKGPGVDRCGDVFKHANHAGTSKHGGVLLIAGDDHGAKSSTLPHQSDHEFISAIVPVLYPAGVQEYLDLGIHGYAMSRYSGCYVGMKAVTDTVESTASVIVDPDRIQPIIPTDFPLPEGGVNIRWPHTPLEQEKLMHDYKIYMAIHYARVNQLNKIVIDSPRPKLGIMAAGKAYLDVRQALEDLGIDDELAKAIGLRVFKVGMIWPLEPEGVRHFAEGLEEILVVEEKRQVLEYQLKEQLYNWNDNVRPRIVGKFDAKGEWVQPHGDWLLPAPSELTPAMIARVIAARIAKFYVSDKVKQRVSWINDKETALSKTHIPIARAPYFCSGCPHNTSTKVPEGSRAVAGIGCHYMAVWMDRAETFTQMGGEGVPWIGQAPFTNEKHIFANLGDGTYYHSGILAVRQSIAAKVNITYKILYNDAVAMTGGQPHDGPLSPLSIMNQMRAEGVQTMCVITDEPEKYDGVTLPSDVAVYHRTKLDEIQRQFREVSGTSVIVYDQTCAAEKRRRRKIGKFPDPAKRVVINEAVCEGCGDCGVKSNCVSVMPLETEFGRKRTIDQSSCNKDFSCVNGFCPSFVTVEGGALKKPAKVGAIEFGDIPTPTIAALDKPYNILATGIGGTGVLTVGQVLGMAAFLEGKGMTILDMSGLAQKNGSVMSHIRIAPTQEALHATRVAAGEAHLVLGCDVLTTTAEDSLAKMAVGVTRAVINSAVVMPAGFTRQADMKFPLGSMERVIAEACGTDAVSFLDATKVATRLMGDSIATNLFVLGYAWQKGLVPLLEATILRAIELNGAAIEMNKNAFLWGRRAAVDLKRVEDIATPKVAAPVSMKLSESLEETIERRVKFLTDYQNAGYAKTYSDFVAFVRQAETAKFPGKTALTEAVARYYFKLLAVKDEYEVARLHSNGEFETRIAGQFEGDYKLNFHLAPPLFSKKDPVTGELIKKQFGPWMMKAFRFLASRKGLRNTALDIFKNTDERRMEQQLKVDYRRLIEEVVAKLAPHNYTLAVQLAQIPEDIRGYGHVKERHFKAAKAKEASLKVEFDAAKTVIGIAVTHDAKAA